MADFFTKLFRWPAEAAARRRIAVAPIRVIAAKEIQKPSGIPDLPLTETIYTVQDRDGRTMQVTWSTLPPGIPSLVEALQDWSITHGGK